MTTETTEVTQDDVTVETENKSESKTVDAKAEQTALEAQLAETKAELAKNAELLAKVRKFEKENKEAAEKALKEQGKFKELYEEEQTKRATIEQKFKDRMVNEVVTQHLNEVGAKSINTVMKLIDKNQIVVGDDLQVDVSTVKLVVAELMKSDPVLFGKEEQPVVADQKKETVDVKRATDTKTVTSYEKEIMTARSMKEIESIMKKYGKA